MKGGVKFLPMLFLQRSLPSEPAAAAGAYYSSRNQKTRKSKLLAGVECKRISTRCMMKLETVQPLYA
jgi:hypothetical protein